MRKALKATGAIALVVVSWGFGFKLGYEQKKQNLDVKGKLPALVKIYQSIEGATNRMPMT